MEPTELLYLQPSEPIASESVSYYLSNEYAKNSYQFDHPSVWSSHQFGPPSGWYSHQFANISAGLNWQLAAKYACKQNLLFCKNFGLACGIKECPPNGIRVHSTLACLKCPEHA